jgi:hypothetical protein
MAATDSTTARNRVAAQLRAIMSGQALIAVVGLLSFVLLFSYPTLSRLSHIGVVWDWPEVLQRNWAASYTVAHFHQLPLWNPFACGGLPLLAHPLSQVLTPLFALPVTFGANVGLLLQIPVHLAIAWTGGYVLASILGMGNLGRLTCASIFPASSWFFLHIGVGHINHFPEAYLPWIAVLVWLGTQRRSLWPWIAAAIVFAIMFGEGGVYECTHAALLVGVIVLWRAAVQKSPRPILGAIILGLFAIGLAAIKLLPTWHMMQLHPRTVDYAEYNSVRDLLTGLFTRQQFYDRARLGEWGFWESGAYLSPAAIALAVLGAVCRPRRSMPWVLAAGVFFILAIGAPRPWSPWALLHHLPFLSSERVPARFLMTFTLVIGVIAGFGADFLTQYLKTFGGILGFALLVIAVFDAWLVSGPNLDAAVAGDLPAVKWSPEFRQFHNSDPWGAYPVNLANEGSMRCNEELDFHEDSHIKVTGYNQPGYRGEQYLRGPGQVTLRRWTPNALSYEVDTPANNVMVVNENYDHNWRLVKGNGDVFSDGGLVAVHLPAGKQRLKLAYRDYFFLAGAAATLMTCVAVLTLWRREI